MLSLLRQITHCILNNFTIQIQILQKYEIQNFFCRFSYEKVTVLCHIIETPYMCNASVNPLTREGKLMSFTLTLSKYLKDPWILIKIWICRRSCGTPCVPCHEQVFLNEYQSNQEFLKVRSWDHLYSLYFLMKFTVFPCYRSISLPITLEYIH